MAGNPDQQEDTIDDQYQEEGEDEVCGTHCRERSFLEFFLFFSHFVGVLKGQEELAGGLKREEEVEEEGEDPYNEDNNEQVSGCNTPSTNTWLY